MSPFEEGQALMMRGNLNAAVDKLSHALNGDFFNEDILFYLGSCFQAMGWNGLSAVMASAAIDGRKAKKEPHADLLINLGAAYKSEQKMTMAQAIWEDAFR